MKEVGAHKVASRDGVYGLVAVTDETVVRGPQVLDAHMTVRLIVRIP